MPTTTTYDEVPYPSGAFEQTHPRRLATIASLFGMRAPDIGACRVLELGCAGGGNLLPMAMALPGASFLGVDLSARQIAEGRRWVDRLGLHNLRLEHRDILDLGGPDLAPGSFDYIIAHGVYSWVPEPVQEKILALAAELLAPSGVAYISYATFPGCHLRRMLRDMMRFHTRDMEPERRVAQARALAAFLVGAVPPAAGLYAAILKAELARVQKLTNELLLHDDLADVNDPIHFHDFVARADRHGLKYLGEALFADMQDQMYRPEVREALRQSGDLIAHEQYLDFLSCRGFRQTLLCRHDVPLERSLGPLHLMRFHVQGRAVPVSMDPDLTAGVAQEFKNASGVVVGMDGALAKAALVHLWVTSPAPISFADLLEAARARLGLGGEADPDEATDLGEALLAAYSGDMVELCLDPPDLVLDPGDRPRASPLARLQAEEGNRVTSLLHRNVVLDKPAAHELLKHLNGENDRAALVDALAAAVAAGRVALEGTAVEGLDAARRAVSAELDGLLQKMGRFGLLLA